MLGSAPQPEYKVVGTRPIRHDAYDKVTGRAVFGADVHLPGMLYGEVLRSPHAGARIASIDTSDAEALPGVYAAITRIDMPVEFVGVVEYADIQDLSMNVLAKDDVRYIGQPVAAVAAIDRNTAIEALRKIRIEYEKHSAVTNLDQAVEADAPLVDDALKGDHLDEKIANTNIAEHFRHELGDPEAGFKASSIVVDRTFTLATVHQGYIEPQNATARWSEDGRLELWSSTQGAFGIRAQTAALLGIPESMIKVNPVEIGGGFGGKGNAYLPPVAALLAKRTGRPVQVQMDRKSVFESTGPSPGGKIRVMMGVDDDGAIQAATAEIMFEAGSYPGSAVGAAATCMFSPYAIPNMCVDGYDILLNIPPAGAYRAPGAPQASFACESVIDEICEERGWDRLEFRLKNASKEGLRRVDGIAFTSLGMEEVQRAAMGSDHWSSPLERRSSDGKLRGRGVASGYWPNGGGESSVLLTLGADGAVAMSTGSADLSGIRVAIAMQVAEVLGIPADDVHPTIPDTDSIGYAGVSGGSRTTYATGQAAYNAARSLVSKMEKRAASVWGIELDDVQFADGTFSSRTDPELRLPFRDLASQLGFAEGAITASESVNLTSAGAGAATHIVDIEVDPETGKANVLRYTSIQDVGKAVHPAYVEGQLEGAAAQGIGWALNEEYYFDDRGEMLNSSFLDYRMPTTLDVPSIETILVEVPNPLHPFGVRGVGEAALIPPLAAIRNAIYDAIGVYLYELPMKPSRILAALEEESS